MIVCEPLESDAYLLEVGHAVGGVPLLRIGRSPRYEEDAPYDQYDARYDDHTGARHGFLV